MGDKISSILIMIVVVAGITTVVGHANSAKVIKSMGTAFSDSIHAALGNK